MIQINIVKQSNYPVSSVKVRNFLKKFFAEHGIVSDAEVTVTFVGEKEMLALAKKYYKDTKLHNVFSFVESEVSAQGGPAFGWKNNSRINLGETVVCFPVALAEAKKENKLIEEKVLELVGHSGLHLLGIHHKE
jgi:rRNA maturation RNase YbeY